MLLTSISNWISRINLWLYLVQFKIALQVRQTVGAQFLSLIFKSFSTMTNGIDTCYFKLWKIF